MEGELSPRDCPMPGTSRQCAAFLWITGILGDQEQLEGLQPEPVGGFHSYTAQISGVYYCDGGCLDEGISQEEMEEVLLAGEASGILCCTGGSFFCRDRG